jgi:hypothetical protein
MGIQKATILNLTTGRSVTVPFNPEEYSLDSSNSFDDKPADGGGPTVQFESGGRRTLTMNLFADSTPSRTDVRLQTQPIVGLAEKDSTLNGPPFLLFSWGGFQFRCVLKSINQRFAQFLPDGTPVRAYLTLTFVESERPGPSPGAKGATPGAVHEVAAGENLSRIAAKTGRDPAAWRQIALLNNIENPRKLNIGATVKLSL